MVGSGASIMLLFRTNVAIAAHMFPEVSKRKRHGKIRATTLEISTVAFSFSESCPIPHWNSYGYYYADDYGDYYDDDYDYDHHDDSSDF